MHSEAGTYILVLDAAATTTLSVGQQGEMAIEPGWYLYVGSAFGPGGVRARVRRHARSQATHWHIDYLRPVTTLRAVWYTHDAARRECDWASVLAARPGVDIPLEGVGATDCACAAHLLHQATAPALDAFREAVTAHIPNHAPIHSASLPIASDE